MNLNLFYFLIGMFFLVFTCISLLAFADRGWDGPHPMMFGLVCGLSVVAVLALFFGTISFYEVHVA